VPKHPAYSAAVLTLDLLLCSLPSVFADANEKNGPAFWDYDKAKLEWSDPSSYAVIQKVGRGKYSEVFVGIDERKPDAGKVVIKILKPVKKQKIRREIHILNNLRGGPNIIELLDRLRDPQSKTLALVFEHVDAQDFKVRHARPPRGARATLRACCGPFLTRLLLCCWSLRRCSTPL